MDKVTKAIILLIGVGIVFNIVKNRLYPTRINEIIVDGHHVDKEPCVTAMNQLFGRGIDSSRMCDCMIPKFYDLIKHDPSKIKKFEEMGFFKLEGSLNDSLTLLFGSCARQSVADSTYIFDIGIFKDVFIKKLKDTLASNPEFRSFNSDSLANCLFQSLNGKVTIKEYFSDDYLKVDKIRNALNYCLHRTE